MKLNINCIRDVLLSIEEKSNLNDDFVPIGIHLNDLFNDKSLSSYSDKEIVYTIKKLYEAEYIKADFQYASNTLYICNIYELTYEGHQLLDSIRNNKIFETINQKLDKFGSSVTVEILKLLATNLVKEKLGI